MVVLAGQVVYVDNFFPLVNGMASLGDPIIGVVEIPAIRGATSPRSSVRWVSRGMTPIDALRAATVNGADLLGRSAEIGTLEPEKFADIVAVKATH